MSETLRDLVVSLSLNSDNFTRNIRSVQKQIQEAQSSFKLASAGVQNFEKTASGLSAKLDTLKRTGLKNAIELDLTLARGLNYYTGAIFEVKALDTPMGSITGGGRYDNLTGIFGMPGLSGVGISFGADRIFDVLNALELYPDDAVNGTQLMFINFGEKEMEYCLPLAAEARAAGIRTELFPDAAKMKKQMAYANAKGIRFVAMAGENEVNEGKVTLKDMATGEQRMIDASALVAEVKGK